MPPSETELCKLWPWSSPTRTKSSPQSSGRCGTGTPGSAQRAVQALGKAGKSSPIAMEAAGGCSSSIRIRWSVARPCRPCALQDANQERFITTFQSGGMMNMMQQVPGLRDHSSLGLTQAATIPGLIAALDDSDSFVRLRAAEALARLSPPARGKPAGPGGATVGPGVQYPAVGRANLGGTRSQGGRDGPSLARGC